MLRERRIRNGTERKTRELFVVSDLNADPGRSAVTEERKLETLHALAFADEGCEVARFHTHTLRLAVERCVAELRLIKSKSHRELFVQRCVVRVRQIALHGQSDGRLGKRWKRENENANRRGEDSFHHHRLRLRIGRGVRHQGFLVCSGPTRRRRPAPSREPAGSGAPTDS